MTCKEICELLPDLVLALTPPSAETGQHLRTCDECAGKLEEMQKTMALLDEWQAPEPSPYFDVRLKARLREEKAKTRAGWLAWMRKPVLAAVATLVLALGVTVFRGGFGHRQITAEVITAPPGTAVGDLQVLDKNHDLYSDSDLLDDLEVQPNVNANE